MCERAWRDPDRKRERRWDRNKDTLVSSRGEDIASARSGPFASEGTVCSVGRSWLSVAVVCPVAVVLPEANLRRPRRGHQRDIMVM